MPFGAISKNKLLLPALAAALLLLLQLRAMAAGPLVALFNVIPVEGASQSMADDATRLLKESLRTSGRVSVLQIHSDLPSLRRAVSEGRVTTDELTKTAEPSVRIKISDLVGAQYCLSPGISLKDAKLTMAVELLETKSGKKWYESSQTVLSAPNSTMQLTNALQSVTATVAGQLNNNAFSSVPGTPEPQAVQPTTAPVSPNVIDKSDPSAHAQRAEDMLRSGNIAVAIYELRRAVQSEPKNAKWRMLLAQAYIKRGLLDDALRELNRVVQIEPGNEEALQKIAEVYELQGTPGEMTAFYQQQMQKKPKDVNLRLSLGDLFWRKAKVDEAIKMYQAAANIDPNNVAPLDRLARCYATLSQFDESLKCLEEIARIEKTPDPAVVLDRYAGLMPVVEAEIKAISNQFNQGAEAYERQQHSREQYYEQVRELTSRSDRLTNYLDKIPVPAERRASYSHRVLACSLLSQAGASLMVYLETNSEARQSEAKLYLSEAKAELLLAASADAKPSAATPSPENNTAPAPDKAPPAETSKSEAGTAV